MNITILKEFVDLAHTLNFRKTAERMYISQPSLSKHIMLLEQELNIQLFWRTKNNVILTPEGSTILPYVLRILDTYSDLEKVSKTWNREIKGKIRVGYLDAAIRSVFSRSITAYREKYPDMEIILQSCQMGELMNALNNGGVDLAICLRFSNMRLSLETVFTPLTKDRVGLALPKGHPLAEKGRVYFENILDYPIVLPSHKEFVEYAQLIQEQIDHAPRKPLKRYECDHIDTVQIMVESGFGIALLPKHIAMCIRDVEFRLIEDFEIGVDIGIYRRRDNHTIGMDEFIATLKAVISGGGFYDG